MKGLKVFGCVGVLALLVAASGASAEEGEAVKSVLGSIGIIPKEKPPIVYNERPPLVLPPKMTLRPPGQGRAEAHATNWPKDPDVAAARKAAEEARKPYTSTELYKNSNARPLSPEEMRAGRDPNNHISAANPPGKVDRQADYSVMSPDELRSFGTSKNDNVKLTGGGLERRYLSDPPSDLLKAAPGAPVQASVDVQPMVDPESPLGFILEQQKK